MNTAERRELVLQIIASREITTVSYLAAELCVSDRTIYRDIVSLSLTYPISTIPGKGGGVYITNLRAINYLYLKEEEIALLEKIVCDIENDSVCSLDANELLFLKRIISLHKKPQKKKGKGE